MAILESGAVTAMTASANAQEGAPADWNNEYDSSSEAAWSPRSSSASTCSSFATSTTMHKASEKEARIETTCGYKMLLSVEDSLKVTWHDWYSLGVYMNDLKKKKKNAFFT